MKILLTGASRGIGFEIAKLLSEKHKLLTISRTYSEKLKELKNVNFISFDLSESDNYKILEDKLKDKEFDILINNAGGGAHSKLQKISIKKMNETINLNLNQAIWLSHLVSKNMIKNKFGIIINIISIHGLEGNPNSSLYSASKFALRGFGDSIQKELKKHNIKVINIYPSFVDTSLIPSSIKNRNKMTKAKSIAILVETLINLPNDLVVKDIILDNI